LSSKDSPDSIFSEGKEEGPKSHRQKQRFNTAKINKKSGDWMETKVLIGTEEDENDLVN